VDDIALAEDGTAKLGRLASYIRDKRIPLELCPTSNVNTGAVASLAEHPVELLRLLRFRVTVNTDGRLVNATTMSGEFARLSKEFGYGIDTLRWFTVNAMKSAFVPHDERLDLIDRVIKPGFARLRTEHVGASFFRQEDPWWPPRGGPGRRSAAHRADGRSPINSDPSARRPLPPHATRRRLRAGPGGQSSAGSTSGTGKGGRPRPVSRCPPHGLVSVRVPEASWPSAVRTRTAVLPAWYSAATPGEAEIRPIHR